MLLIKTYGTHHAVIDLRQLLQSIGYLKYQIPDKQEVFFLSIYLVFGILFKYHFMSICYNTVKSKLLLVPP